MTSSSVESLGLVVRRACSEDADAIWSLLGLMDREDEATRVVDLTPRSVRAALESPHIHTVLAFDAGRAIGLVTSHETCSTLGTHRAYWIDDLFVVAAQRRRGVGTALIETLSAVARAAAIDRIDWHVYADNAAAIRFYERIGATVFANSRIARLSLGR